MIQFNALILKELKEALRDRRALMASLIFAVLAPVIIYALSKTTISDIAGKPDVFINIDGAEYAPRLVEVLNQEGIYPSEEATAAQKKDWQSRSINLNIPKSYQSYMANGRTIDLLLYADMSDQSISAPLNRIQNVIRSHANEIVTQRVVFRGISTEVIQPFAVQKKDTAAPNANAMFISSALLFYLVFGAFITGIAVAVDTSAGERERNVLELLLSQPVAPNQVIAAKLCSASLVSIVGVVLTLLLTYVAVSFIDLSAIGASFQLDISTILFLIAMLVPICVFASIIQLYLAFQAKTFKEAQSTVTIVMIAPGFIPFALMMMDNKLAWLEWMPVSGQFLLMEQAMKGASVSLELAAVVSLVTLAATFMIYGTLAKKLGSEKTILALS